MFIHEVEDGVVDVVVDDTSEEFASFLFWLTSSVWIVMLVLPLLKDICLYSYLLPQIARDRIICRHFGICLFALRKQK